METEENDLLTDSTGPPVGGEETVDDGEEVSDSDYDQEVAGVVVASEQGDGEGKQG